MKSLVDWFMGLDFRKAIWLAPLAWALHEAEEWDIMKFESRHFVDPGYFSGITHPALWFGLGLVASYGIIWTALTAWPKNPRFAAFLTLPFFFFISFGNVLQHIYWSFYFRAYAPGVITAVLLVGPVVIGLTVKAVRGKLIPWWYAAILCLLVVPVMVSTVRAGNHLTPMLEAGQRNAMHIRQVILGNQ